MRTSILRQSLSNQKNIRELGKKTENAMGKSEQNFNARTLHKFDFKEAYLLQESTFLKKKNGTRMLLLIKSLYTNFGSGALPGKMFSCKDY